MEPKVSFVIPCYKLAHFLNDCVNSILAQTYGGFEILIVDDCSPDNTQGIAAEFKDPRVIYIRNETNLGNVRNYNKGIELSRGRYVWLISADDCLRSRNVLQRYVDLLDENPKVGYVFCPAIVFQEGKECGVLDWMAWPGDRDRILNGREVVRRAADWCPVCAPTGLVRKECYQRFGGFPLNLLRTGDWYLWAIFAMRYDVGYFAEPMAYYRDHTTNMEKTMEKEQTSLFFEEELLVRWLIKKEAEKAGIHDLSSDFCRGLATKYASRIVDKEVQNWRYGRTWDAVVEEVREKASTQSEADEILHHMRILMPNFFALAYTQSGTRHYQTGQLDQAARAFWSAISSNPRRITPWIYFALTELERVFGIKLIPLMKPFMTSLIQFLRFQIRYFSPRSR